MNPHDHPKWDLWNAQSLTEAEMRREMEMEENGNSYFFNTIVRKAHERPVNTADFEEFIGCQNWLLIEDPEHGDEIVCEFVVRRVFDNGRVEILVGYGQNYMVDYNVNNGVAMHIDADELAIRMDAS